MTQSLKGPVDLTRPEASLQYAGKALPAVIVLATVGGLGLAVGAMATSWVMSKINRAGNADDTGGTI